MDSIQLFTWNNNRNNSGNNSGSSHKTTTMIHAFHIGGSSRHYHNSFKGAASRSNNNNNYCHDAGSNNKRMLRMPRLCRGKNKLYSVNNINDHNGIAMNVAGINGDVVLDNDGNSINDVSTSINNVNSFGNIRSTNENRMEISLTSQLPPMKAMIFIDCTWLYYSVAVGRSRQGCPISTQFGENWKDMREPYWSQLPIIASKDINRQLTVQDPGNRRMEVIRTIAFTSMRANTPIESIRQKMIHSMQKSNFEVHKFVTEGTQEKCVDIALAVEMLSLATVPEAYDIAVIITGDKDFIPAMQKTRMKGKRVALMSMKNSCSMDLLKQGSNLRDFDIVWMEDYLDELIKPATIKPNLFRNREFATTAAFVKASLLNPIESVSTVDDVRVQPDKDEDKIIEQAMAAYNSLTTGDGQAKDIDWSLQTVKELKEACRQRSLPVGGVKSVLIQRLVDHQSHLASQKGTEQYEQSIRKVAIFSNVERNAPQGNVHRSRDLWTILHSTKSLLRFPEQLLDKSVGEVSDSDWIALVIRKFLSRCPKYTIIGGQLGRWLNGIQMRGSTSTSIANYIKLNYNSLAVYLNSREEFLVRMNGREIDVTAKAS